MEPVKASPVMVIRAEAQRKQVGESHRQLWKSISGRGEKGGMHKGLMAPVPTMQEGQTR